MDTEALVKEGQRLVGLLDEAGYSPKGAMLVRNSETDVWRFWLVPPKELEDKQKFYAKISSLIVDNQDEFSLLDAGDVDLRLASHPAIVGLTQVFRVEGVSSIHLIGNTLNGYYLPEGVILRMTV